MMNAIRPYLVLVLLLSFAFTASADEGGQTGDAALGVGVGNAFDSAGFDGFGDVLFQINIGSPAGDGIILGVEYVPPYLYFTGANDFFYPHKVYVMTTDGTLVDTFNQPTISLWGWRDLAWDGAYLYASDSGDIDYFTTDGTVMGSFSGPIDPNQALAYDPDTGNFWTANNSSDIYEFNETDGVVNQYSNPYSIYGMAWDDFSPDGPWLWTYANSPNYIYQFDPVSGTFTGVSISAAFVEWTAGGLTFTSEWPGTDQVLGMLLGVNRGFSYLDHLFGMEVYYCDGCLIDDSCYSDGETSPENVCLVCDPDQSTGEWSYNNGAPCVDGVDCTEDDTCSDGECAGTPNDALCEDGLWCTGADTCDPVNDCESEFSGDERCTNPDLPFCDDDLNACVECLDASDCDDGVDCTIDTCDGTGACVNTPDDAFCDDDLWCTGDETCDSETGCESEYPAGDRCAANPDLPFCDEDLNACVECLEASHCDDGVDCTIDSCDGTGACVNTPDDAFCDDDLWCTGAETCDPETGCESEFSGNERCTNPDLPFCDEDLNQCVACKENSHCDDGVDCTEDSCEQGTGTCSNVPNDALCDDEVDCTDDVCDPDLDCRFTPNDANCDDGVDCTDDVCDQVNDCEFTPNDAFCDDGEFCNGEETCDEIEGCLEGEPVECPDDGEFCSGDEYCDEENDECASSGDPCREDEVCNEDTDECDPLGDDDDDDEDDDDDDSGEDDDAEDDDTGDDGYTGGGCAACSS